jgi:lipid II:glycine glycyltransferase (peptidoglycan interpeptide bridge formation enzyme)
MKAVVMRPFTEPRARWNATIASLPGAHLLQTWEWAQVKATHGWQPMPFVWDSHDRGTSEGEDQSTPKAAAMVLKKQIIGRGLAARLCVLYVPKGPLLQWKAQPLMSSVLDDLQTLARREGAIFVKIDPDVVLGRGIPAKEHPRHNAGGPPVLDELRLRGWVLSTEQIQFRNTVMIDLSSSEEGLLARMKQKTRYNIRLAAKKGVLVRPGRVDELPLLYRLYAETSARDGFVIRNQSYYEQVWTTFMRPEVGPNTPAADCLIAEVEGEIAAAIFVFYFAGRAYYLYGMSRTAHREKMPNHLLQWEAMRLAKKRGCRTYDLWGAPDEFSEKDPLWGVFRFKEGFGGEVVRTLGAWDFPSSQFWYPVYTRLVPRILDMMRWRGRARTRQDAAMA